MYNQIVQQRIDSLVEGLLPYGAGNITETRMRTALDQVAQIAYREGDNQALLSLMTTEDMAAKLNVTPRRVRALAARRRVGWQVSRHTWIFKTSDIESLRPGPPGRRPNQIRTIQESEK